MTCCNRCSIVGIVAVVAAAGTFAFAQATKDTKPATKPAPTHATPAKTTPAAPPTEMNGGNQMPQLPPGWTEADMQACAAAAMPGPEQERLMEGAGTWSGKTKMWMAPDTEPMMSECTTTLTPIMDGRYLQCDTKGDIPGMGPFHGLGFYGYDNVSQTYQATWFDNCSTGMMTGTGELSSDGKTMTWTYHYTCPITKKPTTMREVHRKTGPDATTLEMYTIEPKSGKEYKMMEIAMTRQPGKSATAVGHER